MDQEAAGTQIPLFIVKCLKIKVSPVFPTWSIVHIFNISLKFGLKWETPKQKRKKRQPAYCTKTPRGTCMTRCKSVVFSC